MVVCVLIPNVPISKEQLILIFLQMKLKIHLIFNIEINQISGFRIIFDTQSSFKEISHLIDNNPDKFSFADSIRETQADEKDKIIKEIEKKRSLKRKTRKAKSDKVKEIGCPKNQKIKSNKKITKLKNK